MSNSFHRRSVMTGLIAGSAALLAAPHVARAAPRTLKLGHNSVATSQFGQGSQAFADAVAAHPDLASAYRVEVHGNAEFGDEMAMLTDCRRGTIDLITSVSSTAGVFCPEVGVLDIPFVFQSVDRGRAAIDGALGEEYAGLLKAKDIHVLAWYENGLRHLTSNRAIRSPADMKGLKLRTAPSEVAITSFRSLGADAQALAFNQVYEALRSGQFEAQENPIATIEGVKFFQVQKYLCLTGHTYSVGMLVASPDLIEDLTPKQRAAMQACGKVAVQRTREVAQTAADEGIGRLQASGMTVISDVDKAAFVKAARPNLEAMGAKFGPERVQHLIDAAGGSGV